MSIARDQLVRHNVIAGWMAVVVVSREIPVTVLRGFVEQSGGDFSARAAGKLKVIFQFVAVSAAILVIKFEADSLLLILAWNGSSPIS